jgi:hypothetical protein
MTSILRTDLLYPGLGCPCRPCHGLSICAFDLNAAQRGMLRALFGNVTTARQLHTTALKHTDTGPSSYLRCPRLQTPDEHRTARNWVDSFAVSDIPKEALTVSYSRSSGPGGQVCQLYHYALPRMLTDKHVNKTNSKATIRCDLASASWLPPFVLAPLRRSVRLYLCSPRPQWNHTMQS